MSLICWSVQWYPDPGGLALDLNAKFALYDKYILNDPSDPALSATNLDGMFTKYASGPNSRMYVIMENGPVMEDDSSRYVSNCFSVNGEKVGVEMHMTYFCTAGKYVIVVTPVVLPQVKIGLASATSPLDHFSSPA